MKKNIYLLLLLLLGTAFVVSCNSGMEELFSENASQRMNKEMEKYQNLLVEPTNGWSMEYYPGGANQVYGGFMLTAKFEKDGSCVFQSILSDKLNDKAKSYYKVGADVGVTLNFDTFNRIFHAFSDPDPGSGDSMEGDYEFVFESGNSQEIVMTGKRHHSIIKMHPLAEDATAFLTKVKAVFDSYYNQYFDAKFSGMFAGMPIHGTMDDKQYLTLTLGEENTHLSFMCTDKGVQLYQPVTFRGRTIKDLVWNPETGTLSSSDNLLSLSINPKKDGYSMKDMEGSYTLFYSGQIGNKMDVELKVVAATIMEMSFTSGLKLYLKYNPLEGVMELSNMQRIQNDKGLDLRWLAISADYAVGTDPKYGMLLKWNGDKEHSALNFVSNGKDSDWEKDGVKQNIAGFAVFDWNAGPYKGFGEVLYMNMRLVKK